MAGKETMQRRPTPKGKAISTHLQSVKLFQDDTHDDVLAEVINTAFQLLVDNFNNSKDGRLFSVGKVQHFGGCIREKAVLFDPFCQWVTQEEVWMDEQGKTGIVYIFFTRSCYLIWGDKKQPAFIMVIIMLAVSHFSLQIGFIRYLIKRQNELCRKVIAGGMFAICIVY